jgi:TfoX/Sxy family transcriptional regulator of competence genes
MSGLNAHLKELVAELSAELPEVTERRMFGSEAFFANSNIYSLIWDGRILLRFPAEPRFLAARALEGSGLFDPMGTGKTMGKWVAMPEEMSDDVDALRPWVEEAHQLAMREPPKKKKAPRAKVQRKKAPARRR